MKRRNKKGFMIVEVVLAVIIAVLVSVAAASVVVVTRSTSNKAELKHNAVGQVGAILECFKASDDAAQFKKLLKFTYDKDYNIDNASSSYELCFYFNKDGSAASKITALNGYTGDYEYFVYVTIDCKTSGVFTDATFNAKVYEYMPVNTQLETVDKLKIYDFNDTFDGGYRKGGAA